MTYLQRNLHKLWIFKKRETYCFLPVELFLFIDTANTFWKFPVSSLEIPV